MQGIDLTERYRAVVLICLVALGSQFTRLAAGSISPSDDRASHSACQHCGMNRAQFAHSRLLITYADGEVTAVCSMHCAALDLALNIGRQPQSIRAGDYRTRELIDGNTAHWVLGGKKPGVMSRRAKWAFASKQSADEFIREHGGRLIDFSGALRAAYEDMYDDVAMLRKKRLTQR